MPLGLYLSVPFCRTKCSFCNFASDVFSRARFDQYVVQVCNEIEQAEAVSRAAGGEFERAADSIYLGGGTPSVLAPEQLERIFAALRHHFDVAPDAEVTVECAPGTISDEVLGALGSGGVNRVSLGVQSFSDQETRAVGRLHTRAIALADIARLRAAGIREISLDLIAGLPHQTEASWQESLAQVVAAGVPHASVYMLEVDDESRLGRELIAGGTRYHAHFVPDEDTTATLYEQACAALAGAGTAQYEISNFARPGHESRHNLKYWTRRPYLGFGVDAHSMLRTPAGAVRFATPDNLEDYIRGAPRTVTGVSRQQAIEETFFLGLRLNRGITLPDLADEFDAAELAPFLAVVDGAVADGLLEDAGGRVRLTPRGRLISNELFQRFLAPVSAARQGRAESTRASSR